MARRSSGPSRGSAFGRNRAASPNASARRAPPPQPQRAVAPQPPAQVAPQPTMAAAPGGGIMAQVATTAAGVAIGHTMGHAITGAFMGGNHGEQEQAVAPAQDQSVQPQQQYQSQHQPIAGQDACKFELDQFLACAQNQSNDLTLCEGFNQVFKECKMRYGNMYH